MMHTTDRPIIGDLSMDKADGITLRARTDVGLTRAWACRELVGEWDTLTQGQRAQHVIGALRQMCREAQ